MAEETQVQTETQEKAPEKEVTLDDVYKDAGLDKVVETQTQPQQQQQVQQQPQRTEPSSIPDPYDTEAFKAYQARLMSETTALRQNQASIANYLTNLQRKEAQAALESDIKKAVETVNEVVGHPKEKVIEAMLDARAREDVRFKAIWDNRAKNPVAWQNALKVVSKEIQNDLSVKVDPNLVEAQRARKTAQRQMATTAPEEPDESWNNLSQEQFEQKWQSLITGGH